MDRKIAQKLLISIPALFFITLAISCAIVFSLTLAGRSGLDLSYGQLALLCLGTALIPTGSFVGFFTAFSRVKGVTRPLIFALCAIFPITLAVINIYGIFAIIPLLVRCVIVMRSE